MPLASNPVITALASALLLAAAITELSSRLWPGSYFALLVLCFIALLLNGLFNRTRVHHTEVPAARTDAPASQQAHRQKPEHNRQQRSDGRRRNDRNNSEPSQRRRDKPAADGPREEGTVKWFQRNKGFGFVIRENGEEIFVHQRSLRCDKGDRGRPILRDGERVSFVVAQRDRGPQAEDVQPLERG